MADKANQKPASGITPVQVFVPVFIVFGILLVMMWYGMSHNAELIGYADHTIRQMTDSAAEEIAITADYARSSVRAVSGAVSVSMASEQLEYPVEAINPMLSGTPFSGIDYIRADGMDMTAGGGPLDVSATESYARGIRGNSGIWVDTRDDGTVLNFYTPLLYGNVPVGVLNGRIDTAQRIIPALETTFFGEPAYGLLFDGSGNIIATTLDAENGFVFTLDEFLARFGDTAEQRDGMLSILSSGTNGAVAYRGPSGAGRVCVTPVQGTDWYAALIIPGSSFSAVTGRSMEKTMAAVLAMFLLLAVYLVFVLAYRRRDKFHLHRNENEAETVDAGPIRID